MEVNADLAVVLREVLRNGEGKNPNHYDKLNN